MYYNQILTVISSIVATQGPTNAPFDAHVVEVLVVAHRHLHCCVAWLGAKGYLHEQQKARKSSQHNLYAMYAWVHTRVTLLYSSLAWRHSTTCILCNIVSSLPLDKAVMFTDDSVDCSAPHSELSHPSMTMLTSCAKVICFADMHLIECNFMFSKSWTTVVTERYSLIMSTWYI